jgi:two-component system, LytTR family, sensor histidine kinase AlgZ
LSAALNSLSSPAAARSIRQSQSALPDFRSLGVLTRILLITNACGLLAALLRADSVGDASEQFARIAVTLEPALLASMAALYLLSGLLLRLPHWAGVVSATAVAAVFAALAGMVAPLLGIASAGEGWNAALWNALYAVLLATVLAGYFDLRQRAFSPALSEARLQALQARIRPHFLFNCLNAVLTLIRRDPRRAEAALEDLAELFRNLMADNRELVSLADEVALTRQYLGLEHLRLGERLKVHWQVDPAAEQALVPPMVLQPLVENAVYHGIEPGLEPGAIRIRAVREGDRLLLELSNPYHPDHQHRQGNRMALANIGERLALHFDVEAVLETAIEERRFHIRIRMPVRHGTTRKAALAR